MNSAGFLTGNSLYVVIAFGVLLIILLVIVINLWLELSYIKQRYRRMMSGAEGGNVEKMIADHIEMMENFSNDKKLLQKDIEKLNEMLSKAITRVSVVRFDAFENIGSDLSYCVAMLDSANNGIVISGIIGRDEARTYVKPIEKGESTYKLTPEEEQALHDAMRK